VRGLVTGTASSLAAGGVLIFGLALWFDWVTESTLIIGALGLAGILWLIAALQFIKLREPDSEVVTLSKNEAISLYINYLKNDQELRKFIYTRALLTATAIAPPFLILLAQAESGSIVSQLGALVIAASFSTFISGRVWGKLSDQSTKAVLSIAGLAGGTVLLLTIILSQFDLFNTFWFLPLILFVLMTSYQGVRIARSIHLVNLATEDTRAAYTALSNTIIGIVLLGTGFFGVLAELVGITVVVLVLATMSLLGGLLASRLVNP
jgi:predicted MFS family arabinose efflux permease